jgi:hypothetical protein
MDAGIGPSGTNNDHGFLGQLKDGGFDGFLYGGLIRLPLPSGVA